MQITRTFDAHYVINHLHAISIWNAMLVIEWLWTVRSVGKYFVIRRVTLSIWEIFIPCLWTRGIHKKFCYLQYISSNKNSTISIIVKLSLVVYHGLNVEHEESENCFIVSYLIMKLTTFFQNCALFLKILQQFSQSTDNNIVCLGYSTFLLHQ